MGIRIRLKYSKKRLKLIGFILCITVLYNEHLSYWFDSLTWPHIKSLEPESLDCKNILIVADPQILGSTNDILGWISAKDSDRYIQKAFYYAIEHVQPDVIIFLGDLMDEGSTSTDEDYESYKQRFSIIFSTSRFKSKIIYLPGDNDIGGESNDQVTLSKVDRFNHHFSTDVETIVGHLQFVTVNRILGDFSLPQTTKQKDKITVVLSHIPLTFIPGIFSEEVMKKLKPNAVFSAHDHRAAMATTRLNDSRYFEASHFYQEPLSKIQRKINDVDCIEVIWPTCSYRMGVENAGYGFASISIGGDMELGVLWVHSRFKSFAIYWIIGLICLAIPFVSKI